MKEKKKYLFKYIYYTLLLLLLASRQTSMTAPSMVLRLAFMAAAIVPTIMDKKLCYPAIITMFYTITLDGFGYSYMPTTFSLYLTITLAITLLFISRNTITNTIPHFILLFAVYIFLIDLLFSTNNQQDGAIVQRTFFCFVLLACFFIMSNRSIDSTLSQLPLCFSVTTIVLSIAFLTHREQFVTMETGDIERSGWTDPNYFGMVLGMGAVVGMIKMFSRELKKLSVVEQIVYIAAVVLSIPAMTLNASRGAMLSVACSFVVLVFYSKVKWGMKFILTIGTVLVIIYLYKNQYFDLLEYRIMEDEGTGSGRTEIWIAKLSAFTSGNPLKMIFGYGHIGGSIISGSHIGFHNDYIGFLVDYGIIGFSLLLYMLLYPIRLIPKGSLEMPSVIVLIVFLATCFLTLEPLLTGIIAYFSFYMYALLLAKNSRRYLCRD